MKISKIGDKSLFDRRIMVHSWMSIMSIGNYLEMTNMKGNEFQRELQKLSFYNKLIADLLNDGLMPPISVVYTGENQDIENNALNSSKEFLILDGLQRTNCLLNCIEKIEHGEKSAFKTKQDFLNKEIYVEIWGNMTLENILYKMIVLNTGQKKMDYDHQLDILSTSVSQRLTKDGVSFITKKEKSDDVKGKLQLSTITEGLASFINGSPLQSKRNAAEFLFSRFNSVDEGSQVSLDLINDEETYNILKWVLVDLNEALNDRYDSENPLIKYDVFFVSVLASMGYIYSLKKYAIKEKMVYMINAINESPDFLDLASFEIFYNSFKTGIGTRKRKLIFDAFKDYFMTPYQDKIEWRLAYERAR